MHISFFIGSLAHNGGTERMTISLANQLTDLGYKVSIISLLSFENTFFHVHKDIVIHPILSNQSKFILKYPQVVYSLFKIIKRNSIDILIDVDVILSLFSIPLKVFNKGLKVISWEHFNYKTNLGVSSRDLARKLAKKYANVIVTLTEQDKNFYLEDGKCKSLIVSISNFIHEYPHDFASLNEKKILAVGRFTHQKGFDILIDVWNEVKQNEGSKDWILQIVGDGEDKHLIKDKIAKLNLSSSVNIIDSKKNISDYYLDSSIYLMTSRYEGLPMVLIEAQCYGLPIIGFDCLTGPRDIISDDINGYLVPFYNINHMVDKTLTLMNDSSLRKKMGEEARVHSNVYKREQVIEKWIAIFDIL